MGWHCQFLFVQGVDAAEAASRLGGTLTGHNVDFDDAISAAHGPGPTVGPSIDGWLVITDPDWQLIHAGYATELSRGARLLRLVVGETVMFAEAAMWEDGVERWAITSIDDNEPPQLTVRGQVPQELLDGRPREDGPYFDVPVDVVHALIGWRYDMPDSRVDDARYWHIAAIPARHA
jgi:hypothetical protein